jgi:hypothetical protein
MLNRRAVVNRINIARSNGVPITNYGMLIAGVRHSATRPRSIPGGAGFLADNPY